jgi:hypothetical protein
MLRKIHSRGQSRHIGPPSIIQGYRNEPDTFISRLEARFPGTLRHLYIGIGFSALFTVVENESASLLPFTYLHRSGFHPAE